MAIMATEKIIDALLLLCRKKSLEDISVKQIVEAAGVSKQTFYNHFSDKYDLIHAVYDTRII